MRLHECLYFVDWCRGSMERSVDKAGAWCWPTRELLAENLRANRDLFGLTARKAFNVQWTIAKRRGWAIEGPCQHGCHANHLQLTAAGREALRLMNEQGCGSETEDHRACVKASVADGFRFRRKAA